MAGIYSEINIKAELRPCMVRDPKTQDLVPALWHCWSHVAEVVAPSPLRGGHAGGQLSSTFALVEFEDGTVAKVHPERVAFLSSAEKFKEYAWPPADWQEGAYETD